MRYLTICFSLIWFVSYSQVPSRLSLGGMTLKLDQDARKRVQAKITSLQKNQRYFEIYLQRCLIYFPVIEIALAERSIPADFKYLALQESALIGDAVSRSNAVGYWQFKKITGLERGLRIDSQVDERKHILSASRAAAAYLKSHYALIKNWVITLLSYNMGLQGALGAREAQQIRNDFFQLDKNTHFYIIHFLAHKLAFESAYKKAKPETVLMIYPTSGGENFNTIASKINVPAQRLLAYNKWLLARTIPTDKPYNFLVPVRNNEEKRLTALGLQRIESHKIVGQVKQKPKLAEPTETDLNQPLKVPQNRTSDPMFKQVNNLSALITGNNPNLIQILQQAQIKQRKFLTINDISLQDPLKPNQVYYLQNKKNKSKNREFHYLQQGETLWDVAQLYGLKVKKLKRLNRITTDEQIQVGRKLHLKKRRKRHTSIEIKNGVPQKKEIVKPEQPKPRPQIVIPSDGEIIKVSNKEQAKVSESELKDRNFHAVKKGETVFSICKLYKVDVLELKRLNNLPNDLSLKEGQILILKKDTEEETIDNPLSKTILIDESGKAREVDSDSVVVDKNKPEPATRPTKTVKTYFPKKNETLATIAQKYKVDLELLKVWNGIEDATKPVKKTVYLTRPKLPPPKNNSATRTEPIAKDTTNKVLVKDTVAEIKAATKDTLTHKLPTADDEKLVKPKSPPKRAYHVVEKGETLYKITKTYKISIAELRNWNALSDNIISIGDTLWVQAAHNKPAKPQSHRVRAGETIYDIAAIYGLSVTEIRKLNNLSPTAELTVNQKIKLVSEGVIPPKQTSKEKTVPAKTSKPVVQVRKHTVKAGETLYQISKLYSISSQDLKTWNDLESNSISIGQELVVSKPGKGVQEVKAQSEPADSDIHIVQKGETLYAISKKYKISVQDILRINNKSTPNLSVGEKLKIKK